MVRRILSGMMSVLAILCALLLVGTLWWWVLPFLIPEKVVDIQSVEDVTGGYVHDFTNGEMELLILHKDKTYEHYLYRNGESYRRGEALYAGKGDWWYKERDIHLDNFRYVADFDTPKICLASPKPPVNTHVTWFAPGTRGREAWLLVYDQPLYVFERWEKGE